MDLQLANFYFYSFFQNELLAFINRLGIRQEFHILNLQ